MWPWCGFVVVSSQRRRPGLDRTNNATGQWHGLRNFVVILFEPCDAWPARSCPSRVTADQSRSTRCAVRTWRSCVVGQRAARPFQRRRPRLNRTKTPTGRRHELKNAVAAAFEYIVARSPRAYRTMKHRSTAHGARAALCAFGVVGLWANTRRSSSPRRRSEFNRNKTATGQ